MAKAILMPTNGRIEIGSVKFILIKEEEKMCFSIMTGFNYGNSIEIQTQTVGGDWEK